MRVPVILGAIALAGAAAVSVSAGRTPKTQYPRIVSDLTDLHGTWSRIGGKQSIYFFPGPFVGTTQVEHSGRQFYNRHDWKTIEKAGDQFRMKFSQGFAFEIGSNSAAGSPNLEKIWETCVVRIHQQSATQLEIERDPASSDPCDWLTGKFRKG